MMTAIAPQETAQAPEIAAVDAPSPLRSVHTNSLAALLEALGSALLVTDPIRRASWSSPEPPAAWSTPTSATCRRRMAGTRSAMPTSRCSTRMPARRRCCVPATACVFTPPAGPRERTAVIELLAAARRSTPCRIWGGPGSAGMASAARARWTRPALRVGNILLGNAEDAAGIEVQVFPFAIRFLAQGGFALTGADAAATLDGIALPGWWAAPRGIRPGVAAAPPGGRRARLRHRGRRDRRAAAARFPQHASSRRLRRAGRPRAA